MDIYLNLDESYSWYRLPKLEQIKMFYESLVNSTYNLEIFELNLRDWKLLTESSEFMTLDDALEKFKKPIKIESCWYKKLFNKIVLWK